MGDPDLSGQIAAAEAYEELHVPALFAQWPPCLLEAVDLEPGHGLLDVACGTGVLAREAVALVGPAGYVAGIDPQPGMLAVAERLEPSVDWRQATAESVPFDDRSFHAVVSQFGLMFFPDRAVAVSEMLRVLRPGGRLAVAVWDSLENSAAYPEEVELLERIAGSAAAEALKAPFVLGDPEELGSLLEDSGAGSVEVSHHLGTARFPSIRTMVEADLRGWLPVMGVTLDEAEIDRILVEAETALSQYLTAEGRVEFEAPALIVKGTKRGP